MSRRLRIGLDAGWIGYSVAGIPSWTEQLFRALIRDNPGHRFTLIWPLYGPPPEAVTALLGPRVELFTVQPRWTLWWRAGRRLGLLTEPGRVVRRLRRLDVLYWSSKTERLFPWLHLLPGVAKVTALFDAIPMVLPGAASREWTEELTGQHARVKELGSWWLTISESARADLVEKCGLDPALGRVIYPGHAFDGSDAAPAPGPWPLARLGVDGPYVLTVCSLEPHKNHIRLFRAFRAAVTADPRLAGWRLMVVGGGGWNPEEIVGEGERTPGVVLAGRLSQPELAAAYRHAGVFAYPSLYEGFGLPVVEAMSFGLPVLTSAVSALPEAAGPAGLLVDPCDEAQMAQALARLMADPAERAWRGEAGRRHARRFSWAAAAHHTMALFQHAALQRQKMDGRKREKAGRG